MNLPQVLIALGEPPRDPDASRPCCLQGWEEFDRYMQRNDPLWARASALARSVPLSETDRLKLLCHEQAKRLQWYQETAMQDFREFNHPRTFVLHDPPAKHEGKFIDLTRPAQPELG